MAILIFIAGEFLAEFLIMVLVVPLLPPLPHWQEALIDGSVLCLVLTPFYYLCLYRPWTRVIADAMSQEAAARHSEALYRTLFEGGAVPTVIVEPDQTIVLANPRFEKLSGYRSDELVGQRRLDDFLAPAAGAEPCLQWKGGTGPQGGEGGCCEGQFTSRSRHRHYVSCARAHIDGGSRSVVWLWEITERREMEDELRRSKQALIAQHDQLGQLFEEVESARQEWETTMDCVDDMVILTDAQGRVKRYNRGAEHFIGQRALPLGESVQHLLEDYDLNFNDMKSQGIEVCNRKSGRWFLLKVYPFLNQGRMVNGMVLTAHDFTETKQMTRQLEQSNRELREKRLELEDAYRELKASHLRILQQEKMASLGQLSAGVAHEINNPIGFIASNLGTMEKYLGRLTAFIEDQRQALQQSADAAKLEWLERRASQLKLDYVCHDALDLIRESQEGAERVKKITGDLKSFARTEVSDLETVDIRQCLEATINIVWNELKYKAELRREYQDLPPLRGYPQELNQVFMNLLINAGQAIDKQGEITVSTTQQEGFACITIADTGCGIPAEHLARVFDPFFTTKEVGEGTGLGLSISYEIVKKHHGDIRVRSDVGKGTTFEILLPLDSQPGTTDGA